VLDSLNVELVANWPFDLGHDPLVRWLPETNEVLYLASSGGGIFVYAAQASEPWAFQLVSSIRTRGVVMGMSLDPDARRLFVAAGAAGLEIWDLSRLEEPRRLAWVATSGLARGVAVAGGWPMSQRTTRGWRSST
jgi:hypothetical protein